MTRLRLILIASLLVACAKKSAQKDGRADDAAVSPRQTNDREILVLRQVVLEVTDAPVPRPTDIEALRNAFASSLVASEGFVGSPPHVPSNGAVRGAEVRLELTYDVSLPTKDEPGQIAVAVSAMVVLLEGVQLPWGTWTMRKTPLHAKDDKQINGELQSLAASTLAAVAHTVIKQAELRQESDEQLLTYLGAKDLEPEMLVWALKLADTRGLKEAVPHAIRALSNPNKKVREEVVSVLVSLKDVRAVNALTEHTEFTNYEDLRVTMEAIASIGGKDAVAFLEFVASGHEDLDIRGEAKAHLRRMGDRPSERVEDGGL